MAWLAVDPDGSEWIFEEKPTRNNSKSTIDSEGLIKEFSAWESVTDWLDANIVTGYIRLKTGSIEKLLGYKLHWQNEPVELEDLL